MADKPGQAPQRTRQYKEVAPEQKLSYPHAKQVSFDSVVGRQLKIAEFEERPSRFQREFAVVHAYNRTLNPDPPYDISFGTGSGVVIRKLRELRDGGKLPVIAKIVQPVGKKYYTLE